MHSLTRFCRRFFRNCGPPGSVYVLRVYYSSLTLDPGYLTDPSRRDFYLDAANAQAKYLLKTVPRMPGGAISMRAATREYWYVPLHLDLPGFKS